jgi:putative ABC transport system permease protein
MKLLGANNIVITPIVEQSEGKVDKDAKKTQKRFTSGLTWLDAQAIKSAIPTSPRRAARSSSTA